MINFEFDRQSSKRLDWAEPKEAEIIANYWTTGLEICLEDEHVEEEHVKNENVNKMKAEWMNITAKE